MSKFTREIKENKDKKDFINATYTVSPKDMWLYSDNAIKHYVKISQITGFRKGQAPQNLVLQKYINEINQYSLDLLIKDIVDDINKSEPKPDPRYQLIITKLEQIKDDKGGFVVEIEYRKSIKVDVFKFPNTKTKITTKRGKATEEGLNEYANKSLLDLYRRQTKNDYPDTKKKDKELFEDIFKSEEIKNSFPQIKTYGDLINEVRSSYEKDLKTRFFNDFVKEIYDIALSKSVLPSVDKEVETELERQAEIYMSKFRQLGIKDKNELKEKFNISIDELKDEWREDVRLNIQKQFYLFELSNELNLAPTPEEVSEYIKNNKKQIYDEKPDARMDEIENNVRIMLKLLLAERKFIDDAISISSFTQEEKNELLSFIAK